MNARKFGALSVTLSAVVATFAVFGVGVAPLEGAAALSPVKTTGVPEPPVSPSTLATSTTTTISASVTSTSSPYVPVYPGVADAVELAVSLAVPGLSIPGLEPRCFDTAIATATVADPDVGAAVDELTADATTWWETDRPIRERFVSAYVGCADFDQLLFFLAIATMNSLDAAPCVAAGWSRVAHSRSAGVVRWRTGTVSTISRRRPSARSSMRRCGACPAISDGPTGGSTTSCSSSTA